MVKLLDGSTEINQPPQEDAGITFAANESLPMRESNSRLVVFLLGVPLL